MLALRRHASPLFVAGGLIILLCTLVGVTLWQIRSEAEVGGHLRAQHEVVADVAALRTLVFQAEAGQRGYLLTDKLPYLDPFLDAQARMPALLGKLLAEIGPFPAARDLRPAVAGKFAELRSTLTARRRSGREAAVAIVETDAGKAWTARIFAALDAIRTVQDEKLERWRHRLLVARNLLAVLAIGSIAVALGCLAAGLFNLRRAGLRLAESEGRFRLLADHTSDMVVRLDGDLVQTFVSPACQAICGVEPDQLVGRTLIADIHPDDQASVEWQLRRVLSGRTGTELMTFRRQREDENFVWLEAAVSLVRDESGAPDTLVASLRDVSSRKLQADELRVVNLELERLARHLGRARDKAERASSAKTRFLAGMSHELRTPLNGMIGYAHLLRLEGGLTEAQSARVAGMLDAGEHLLGMINHVLELSEIEAEHVDLRLEDAHVEQIARLCLALVRPSAEVKRLALRFELDPGIVPVVYADAARLRQILLNLLGNAVKFTSSGVVTVRLREGTEPEKLRIEIADTGPGIPPDQVDRLFGEFERLGAADSAVEGAGLGLAISSRLARLMGGSIGYADNPGGGSIFAVELPIGDINKAGFVAAEQLPSPGRKLRVLVADDVAMNRDIALAFLKAAGHEAVGVDGGLLAVERAGAGGFDVILMDVRMPDIDGLEATRRIRALPGPAAALPIVALTAQAFAEQIEECRAAGMTSHLAKPFAPASLLAAIESAARTPVFDAHEPVEAKPPLFDEAAFRATAGYLEPAVVVSYLDMIEERASTLLTSLAGFAEDDPSLPSAAHEFAGSAGLFGFARASDLARRLERALQTASPDAPRLSSALQESTRETLPLLRARRADVFSEHA